MALIAKPVYSLIPPFILSAKPMVMTSIVIAVRECRPTRAIGRFGPAHSRKLIEKGDRREDVADILNVSRTTLYRALAGA
jgi:hypothetical protein